MTCLILDTKCLQPVADRLKVLLMFMAKILANLSIFGPSLGLTICWDWHLHIRFEVPLLHNSSTEPYEESFAESGCKRTVIYIATTLGRTPWPSPHQQYPPAPVGDLNAPLLLSRSSFQPPPLSDPSARETAIMGKSCPDLQR